MSPEKIDLLLKGLQVSLYGLGGVFAVLILFYAVTKLMTTFIREKPSEDAD